MARKQCEKTEPGKCYEGIAGAHQSGAPASASFFDFLGFT